MEDTLRPWPVKVSHVNRFNTADRIAEEAKKLRALRELPGVLQGKGIPYAKDSQAYIVMRQAFATAAVLPICFLRAAVGVLPMLANI